MASKRVAMTAAVAVALLAASRPLPAQGPPPGSSWVEAGGFYHHVSNDFGSWTGGYARLVLAGARDAWYLDAKAQEAFRDRGVYGSFANVHSFGSRVYTQLGVGAGSGDYVLPKLRLDGSLTLKLGPARRVLLTAGGTYVKSKSIYDDQALFASLTWYATPSVLLELGGRVNWSDPGAVRSARAQAALTAGRTGRSILTLRGSAGTEGYQLTGAPVTLQEFKSQDAGLSLRRWLGAHVGIVVGGEWYHNPFYTRAGGSLGLFYGW